MNWYKQIKSSYEEDSFVGYGQWEEEDDMESYEEQAWDLAAESEINILRDKELARVAVAEGKLLGALWTAWGPDDGFSFDVIVDPNHRRMGVGSNLVDQAVEIFEWESGAFRNPHFDIDAVNDDMVRILQKKGFVITGKENGHTLMTRPES